MDMEEGGGFRDLLPWWADNPPKNAQNGQPKTYFVVVS